MCKICKTCFLEGTYISHKDKMVIIDNIPDVIINKVSSITSINFEGTVIQVTADHEVMTPNG
jgi:hypothetical protein